MTAGWTRLAHILGSRLWSCLLSWSHGWALMGHIRTLETLGGGHGRGVCIVCARGILYAEAHHNGCSSSWAVEDLLLQHLVVLRSTIGSKQSSTPNRQRHLP